MAIMPELSFNRRRFLACCAVLGINDTLLPGTLTAVAQDADEITVEMLRQAERLAGFELSDEAREALLAELASNRDGYLDVRGISMDQDVPPSLVFHPVPPGYEVIEPARPPFPMEAAGVVRPDTDGELALLSVMELAALIRERAVSSVELTNLYLDRLKRYGSRLECVVETTEDIAYRQAEQADQELSEGIYRGVLHGIPWGAKDLISVKGTRTTWGAAPFRDRVIDSDATVYKRLSDAGAVLVAKLATTALAGGNSEWFGGETKNPWDITRPTSGSSGGPAAASAAGLVAFSIGTETYGSIINPSSNCGLTGHRPTFGMVSRHGVMPLSWSLDKVGPICRTAEDCAAVLHAIAGPDGFDLSVLDRPFRWDPNFDVTGMRVGYLTNAFEGAVQGRDADETRRLAVRRRVDIAGIETLRDLGVELVPLELPASIRNDHIRIIHHTEGAAMFEDMVLDGTIDEIPNNRRMLFRARRFVPAVDYLQANRARTILMQEMNEVLKDVELYVAPGSATGLTNHTGHPALTLQHGFVDRIPVGLKFIGKLFSDAKMLGLAKRFQSVTDYHRQHPGMM